MTENPITPPVRDSAGPASAPGEDVRWALRGNGLFVWIIGVCSLASGLLEALFLVLIARVALAVAEDTPQADLIFGSTVSRNQGLLLAAVLIVGRLATTLIGVRSSVYLVHRITTGLRLRLLKAFVLTTWPKQQELQIGSLQQLAVAFPSQISALLIPLATSVGSILTLGAMLGVAAIVSVPALVVVLGVLAILGVVLRPLRQRVHMKSEESVEPQLQLSSAVTEVSSLAMDVQVYQVQDQVISNLNLMITNEADSQRRVGTIAYSVSPLYVSLAYLAVVAAIAVLTLIGSNQLNTVGAVMLVMLRMLGYGQSVQQSRVLAAQLSPLIRQVRGALDDFESSTAQSRAKRINEEVNEIRLSNVAFAYDPSQPVLNEISIVLSRGSITGLVGASGSGKSTLIQILLGLRKPQRGSVSVNGSDLSDSCEATVLTQAALVPQQPYILNTSILENVRFFRDNVTEPEIHEQLSSVGLMDEVRTFPNGINTVVGAQGFQLSGGQAQRLALARALVGRPQLLVLDEPTSALDAKSEAVILDLLRSRAASMITVIVTHKESTSQICDHVCELRAGQLRKRT